MILSKFSICNSKNLKFIKEQEAKVLLGHLLGLKIPISGDISFVNTLFQKYKMNGIVNNFLLAGDKFTPERHLKQPGFTYSACRQFTKIKERIKNSQRNRRFKTYLSKRIRQSLFST